MAFADIRYDVEDGVATVTLHRPDRLNAVNGAMLAELIAALDQADGDDAVRAVIVTGAGRAFCAGADLGGGGTTFAHRDETAEEHRDGGGLVTLRIYDMKKPVIAAINGPAAGFGATLTLPMDVRIASTAARIGFVFTRRGIVPEACSTWFLPRLVGIAQAAEWICTGRVFSAEEARAGGLPLRVDARRAGRQEAVGPAWAGVLLEEHVGDAHRPGGDHGRDGAVAAHADDDVRLEFPEAAGGAQDGPGHGPEEPAESAPAGGFERLEIDPRLRELGRVEDPVGAEPERGAGMGLGEG